MPNPACAQAAVGTISAAGNAGLAVNPVTHKLYIPTPGGDLTVVDEFTGAKTVLAGQGGYAVAVNPTTNRIYVAGGSRNSVSVIDGETDTVVSNIAVGNGPNAIVVNPLTNRIYTVNWSAGTLAAINGATNAVTATLNTGVTSSALAMNTVTNTIYVAVAQNKLAVIDGATNAIDFYAAGSTAENVAVNPVTNKVYITCAGVGVQVFDGATHAMTTLADPTYVFGIVVNPTTNKIYVGHSDSPKLTEIDGATNARTDMVLPSATSGVALNQASNQVYAAGNSAVGQVYVIDGATHAISALSVGGNPGAVAVDPVTNRAFFGNQATNAIAVVDGSRNTRSTLPIGVRSAANAVNPVTKKLYSLPASASNLMSILDLVTGTTSTVDVGTQPRQILINPVTNKVFLLCPSLPGVVVYDADTGTQSTVATGLVPNASYQQIWAINVVTNKLYVPNYSSGSITEIDAATLTATDIPATDKANHVAVNSATNKIYVSGDAGGGPVVQIDGKSHAVTTVLPMAGTSYLVVNEAANTLSIIHGAQVYIADGPTLAIHSFNICNATGEGLINPQTNRLYFPCGTDIAILDGNANTYQTVNVGTSTPYLLRAIDLLRDKLYAKDTPGKLILLDGGTNATRQAVTFGFGLPSLDPFTGKVYLSESTSTEIEVVDPSAEEAIPLTATISPVADSHTVSTNNVLQTTNPTPGFKVDVTSAFTSSTTYNGVSGTIDPKPNAVYFQVDGGGGTWTRVAPASVSNPAHFTLTVPTTKPGLHILYAYAAYGDEGSPESAYGGTGGNSPRIGNVVPIEFLVLPIPTTVTVASDGTPRNAGNSVTFTAKVLPASAGSTDPTGTVEFFDGATSLGTATLAKVSGTFVATYAASALTVGNHSITAAYTADAGYDSAISGAFHQQINGAPILITGITPNSGLKTGATFVTINGTGFTGATSVKFGLTPAFSFVVDSDTQIRATSPGGPVGTVDIVLSNGVNTSPISVSDKFTFTETGTVTVTKIDVLDSANASIATAASGDLIHLQATVTSATAVLGSVYFCDIAITSSACPAGHFVGKSLVENTAHANLYLRVTPGPKSYSAYFKPNQYYGESHSAAKSLAVDGRPTTSDLTITGTTGHYDLLASIAGMGYPPVAPTGIITFRDETATHDLFTAALTPGTLTDGLGAPLIRSVPNSKGPSVIADFNNDGWPDLVSIGATPTTMNIYLGDGSGNFGPPILVRTFTGNVLDFVADDFNADGKRDLAVITLNNLYLLTGNNDGTFSFGSLQPLNPGNPVKRLVVGDFNGGGMPDVAVSNSAGLSIFGNSYPFPGFSSQNDLFGFYDFVDAEPVDLNGDSIDDLLMTTSNPGEPLILITGRGGSISDPSVLNAPAAAAGGGLVVGDFNGDGLSDIVLHNGPSVWIMKGQGGGVFDNGVALFNSSTADYLAAADINLDGKLDLVSGTTDPTSTVTLRYGNGDLTFTDTSQKTAPVAISGVFLADRDGDGILDVFAPGATDSNVYLFPVQAQWTAQASVTDSVIPGTGTHALRASYPGDTHYVASSSSAKTATASFVPNTLTLASMPNPSSVGQNVAFTASITPFTYAGYSLGGTVSFLKDTTTLGTGAVTAGAAPYTTSTLPLGPNNIKATYPGDGIFAGSASTGLIQQVNSGAASQLVYSSAPAPSVTAGATVGNVVVKIEDASGNQTTSTATVTLTVTGPAGYTHNYMEAAVSGVATFTGLSSLTVQGTYTYTASLAAATSAVAQQVVNPAAPSTLTVQGGGTQSATVNSAFVAPLALVVADQYGNKIYGVAVTFTAPATGASATLSGPTATTDVNGSTSVTATANATPGTYAVHAAVAGIATPANFALTNTTGAASSVVASSGTPQSTTVNTAFVAPLEVVVRDSANNPVPGVTVTFTTPAAGASANVASASVVTNASGIASTTATANAAVGSYSVSAQVAGVAAPAVFALTNTLGTPGSITVVSGTPQSVVVHTAFAQPLQVLVKDAAGNAVPNAMITFAAPATGPSALLSSATATTNASGIATLSATANDLVGTYFVSASVAGAATPANFALSNSVGAAASVVTNSGTPQTTQVGTAFSAPLTVVVKDAYNNPVQGVAVTFTSPATGPSANIASASVITNASGVASTTVAANVTVGNYAVNARVAGVAAPAVFALTNAVGAPGSITVVSGTPQSTVVHTAFAQSLQVLVKDASNNPVPSTMVTFAGPGAGASALLSSPTAMTNASGIASLSATANDVVGTYSVSASVAGAATPANFSLTNTVGAAATVAAISGTPQSARLNTAFGAPLTVVVKDAFNNLVQGVAVIFTPPATGASANVASASVMTNASGIASTAAIANATIGGYQINARVAGVALPASFALTNTVGTPASISVVSGSPQSTVVHTAFGQSLQVLVKDVDGNPVPNATVTFATPGAGASALLSAATAATNASGIASVSATANNIVGTYAVTASVAAAGTPVGFALTNTVGTPAALTVLSGTPQSTRVSTVFAARLSLAVADSYGNRVPGIAVQFAAPGTAATATLSVPIVTTDAQGIASTIATASARPGSYTVSAAAAGNTAQFVLTNLPGIPAKVTIVSGTPQTTSVQTDFAVPLVVAVTDALGNPVPAVAVNFSAPGSGASAVLHPGGAVTDASGRQTITATANNIVGSYVVTASVGGLSTAFALQNTASDFTLTAISESTVEGHYGADSTFIFKLTPLTGVMPDAVRFSYAAEQIPPLATVSFSPETLPATAGPTTVTVKFHTPLLANNNQRDLGRSLAPTILAMLALTLGAARRMRRAGRKVSGCLLMVGMLMLALGSMTGCGAGYFSKDLPITVMAQSGTYNHSLSIKLHMNERSQ